MIGRTLIYSCLMLAFSLLASLPASAKPLIADISSHEITIHTAFKGTELMLFGARNDPGDIVVVVRGPEREATVRRKEKVWGIWVNRTQEIYDPIPAFYAMASSRPYEEIRKSIYFDALGVGYDAALEPLGPKESGYEDTLSDPEQRRRFSLALLRFMRGEFLYNQEPSPIEFIGETLFKTTIPFPDKTPRGIYTVEIYLFTQGELVSTHTTSINVYKSGFDAFVYAGAMEYPAIYGVVAVLLALLFGWAASTLFHKI